ncbi:YkgJ family cysteine cluster protein [Stigmatella sp. ncwal1]|uniref:YkgJ family cysteine cluster protein n=1 Tax=Stigmatella ashevillensis TaxID=2995309 RepID=A0ABT5D6J7_9BACT|nr:YkgJ family cysteine cluster protein [Stigmatella ashevillena]MDC0707881.1 YkgJ family cysteine cluster protein [Stigmatella ashevillena]
MSPPGEGSAAVSTLCQHCGLCCDGNLFDHVPLRDAEVDTMRRLSLTVVTRKDGSAALAQHCDALKGRVCTAYAERPEGCRRYHCALFSALAEGEVSLNEALSVVGEAHARIQAVEAVLPTPRADAPRAVLQRARQEDLPTQARDTWTRAEDWLDRHFRGRQRHR